MAVQKRAVVVFNLGGPDNTEAIQPFLFNLFSDKAIISVPNPLRWLIAKIISSRRVAEATEIYDQLGGGSPILPETQAQADALAAKLNEVDPSAKHKVFIGMRYWHPFVEEAVAAVKDWSPDEIVLLPLYPQFSTTTTGTSFTGWDREAKRVGLNAPTRRICCYPTDMGWVNAQADLIRERLEQARTDHPDLAMRVLFSAHGLPKRTVERGAPYPPHVEAGAQAIVDALGGDDLDWRICYQSRVGPLEWIGPQIDEEVEAAARDGVGIILVPIAFVSEHSETLVELDIQYADMARSLGNKPYLRVPTVRTHPTFIAGLADMVLNARGAVTSASGKRECSGDCAACPMSKNRED